MPRKPRPFKRTKHSIAARKVIAEKHKNEVTCVHEESSEEVFNRLLNESR